MSRVRRGLAATALAAVALAACSGSPSADSTGDGAVAVGDPMPDTTDPETGCGPVDRPSMMVATHLVGDAEPPSPYTSVPPTSGWHTAEEPRTGVTDQALRDPEIVSALEAGIVVLAVQPDMLDSTVVSELAEQFSDRLLVVPYTEMPTSVALLTWGALQRCPEVDRGTVTTFVLRHRNSAEH